MEKPKASFAALSQAHRSLLDDLRKLEESTRAESTVSELRTRLGATYTHICEHFHLEELDGYMDEVRKREPRLDNVVQGLREEHRQLRHSLDLIHAEAKLATGLDEALRAKVRNWIERVQHHETRENKLVQDVFDLEIAADD